MNDNVWSLHTFDGRGAWARYIDNKDKPNKMRTRSVQHWWQNKTNISGATHDCRGGFGTITEGDLKLAFGFMINAKFSNMISSYFNN